MSNLKLPKVSVILPVYNSELYIQDAIDSILNQTFTDFEFIIINDGSTDRSKEIIQNLKDDRIIFIDQKNMGLAATLNKGINIAKGEYIARQDNDDVSHRTRLEKQVKFLDAHPEIALLGTAAEIIDEKGQPTGRFHDHRTDGRQLKFYLLFDNPFVHASVLFRRPVIKITGDYSTTTTHFEDHNLWSRIARVAQIKNLPERLVKYREVSSSMSRATDDYRKRVRKQSIENILYYCPDLPETHIETCIDYLSGQIDLVDFNTALNLLKSFLNKLSITFCEKENIPIELISEECHKQILNFKRHYYNKVIYSESASAFSKIKAKILRKIIFMRHKSHLTV